MSKERLTKLLSFLIDSPEDAFLLFAIAKEYEKLEQYDKALNYFSSLRKKSPEYIGLYYHLGKLYELIQQERLALSIYAEGIELAKKQGDFHALSELNTAKMNLEIQLGN